MVVYKITNTVNGKMYIGCTINYAERIKKHLSGKRSGSMLLFKAVNKYGKDAFTCQIISTYNDEASMFLAEKENITKFNSLIPNGYNIHLGGKGGRMKLTEEQIEARRAHARLLSKNNIGNKYSAGTVHTDEMRSAVSKAHKGKKLTAETRMKMSIASIGNQRSKGVIKTPLQRAEISKRMKGIVFSDETKSKMSQAAKARSKNLVRDEKGRITSTEVH
jgi:group I intron endonuclease